MLADMFGYSCTVRLLAGLCRKVTCTFHISKKALVQKTLAFMLDHRLLLNVLSSLVPHKEGQDLSSQCLPKTSLGFGWHRRDTTALSARAGLPVSNGHSPTASSYPRSLRLLPSLSRPHKPHHVWPPLSIRVTSLLLFVLFCPVLCLASLCSRRVAVADCAVAHCLSLGFVMIGVLV